MTPLIKSSLYQYTFFGCKPRESVTFDIVYMYDSADDVACNNSIIEKVQKIFNSAQKYLSNIKTLLLLTTVLVTFLIVVGIVLMFCDTPSTISLPILGLILLITYVPAQLLAIRSSNYVIYSIKLCNDTEKIFQFNCIDNIVKIYPSINGGIFERIKAFQNLLNILSSHQYTGHDSWKNSMTEQILLSIESESTRKMKRIGIYNVKFNEYGKE